MPLEFHGLNLLNYSFNNIFTEQLSHAIVFKVGKTTPKKQRHRQKGNIKWELSLMDVKTYRKLSIIEKYGTGAP